MKERGFEQKILHTGQHFDKNMSDVFPALSFRLLEKGNESFYIARRVDKKIKRKDVHKFITSSYKIIKNNDFLIQKPKRVVISGTVFDAEPLLKTLYNESEKKTFSKNFSSEIKINFDKAITGTDDDVFDVGMIAFINKGSYDKLSLKGNFSKNEFIVSLIS